MSQTFKLKNPYIPGWIKDEEYIEKYYTLVKYTSDPVGVIINKGKVMVEDHYNTLAEKITTYGTDSYLFVGTREEWEPIIASFGVDFILGLDLNLRIVPPLIIMYSINSVLYHNNSTAYYGLRSYTKALREKHLLGTCIIKEPSMILHYAKDGIKKRYEYIRLCLEHYHNEHNPKHINITMFNTNEKCVILGVKGNASTTEFLAEGNYVDLAASVRKGNYPDYKEIYLKIGTKLEWEKFLLDFDLIKLSLLSKALALFTPKMLEVVLYKHVVGKTKFEFAINQALEKEPRINIAYDKVDIYVGHYVQEMINLKRNLSKNNLVFTKLLISKHAEFHDSYNNIITVKSKMMFTKDTSGEDCDIKETMKGLTEKIARLQSGTLSTYAEVSEILDSIRGTLGDLGKMTTSARNSIIEYKV